MRVEHSALAILPFRVGAVAGADRILEEPRERPAESSSADYVQAESSSRRRDAGGADVHATVVAQYLRMAQALVSGTDLREEDGAEDDSDASIARVDAASAQAQPSARYLKRDLLQAIIEQMAGAAALGKGGYVNLYV